MFVKLGYILRYERGKFQSGYCILDEKKIIVVNKFLATEARIHTLIEILGVLPVELTLLPEELQKVYKQIRPNANEIWIQNTLDNTPKR